MKGIWIGSILLAIVSMTRGIVVPINPQAVTVFYDVTSQDNYKFMTEQLFPIYNRCGGQGNGLFDIEYIPCGENVTTTRGPDGSLHFYCGTDTNQRECDGIILHSCALKHLPKELIPSFIHLTSRKLVEGKVTAKEAAREVVKELGWGLAGDALFRVVQQCMESQEGPKLAEVNENEAIKRLGEKVIQTETPCVTFNGEYNPAESRECEQNFMRRLCVKLGIPDMAICSRLMEESKAKSRTKRWRSALPTPDPEPTRPAPSYLITLPTVPTAPAYAVINCGACNPGYVREYINDGIHCGRCRPGGLLPIPSPCGPGQTWLYGRCQYNYEWNYPPRQYCPGCYCSGGFGSSCQCNRCQQFQPPYNNNKCQQGGSYCG